MQANHKLVALGKGDGNGGGGESVTIREGRHWEGKEEKGDERITQLKTNEISAASDRKQWRTDRQRKRQRERETKARRKKICATYFPLQYLSIP